MLKYSISYSSFSTTISFFFIVSVSWPLDDPLILIDILFHLRNTSHTRTINLLHLAHLNPTFDLANQAINIGGIDFPLAHFWRRYQGEWSHSSYDIFLKPKPFLPSLPSDSIKGRIPLSHLGDPCLARVIWRLLLCEPEEEDILVILLYPKWLFDHGSPILLHPWT
jgi:hypothetical protein